MPLDFPSSPTNGQVYQNYYYDGPTGAWRSLSSTVNPIPSTLKNLTISSSETTGVSLKVTPFTTSSVNLQEWYNTSSNVVARMNVAGDLTVNSLTLTTDLTVANGGTGASSFTEGAYIKGNGSAALFAQVGIPGEDITSGQVGPSFGGTPTGGIMQFAGALAPTGWLMCQGQELAIASYTALYNVLTANGTVFPYGANTNGSGAAGNTHFRLPDFRGDVPVGKATSGTFATLGATGGVESVTLDATQIPAHSHPNTLSSNTVASSSHRHNWKFALLDRNWSATGSNAAMGISTNAAVAGAFRYSTGAYQNGTNIGSTTENINSNINSGSFTNQSVGRIESIGDTDTPSATTTVGITNANNTGGGQPHTNLQPYIVINYIIKT